MKLALWGLS